MPALQLCYKHDHHHGCQIKGYNDGISFKGPKIRSLYLKEELVMITRVQYVYIFTFMSKTL